MPIQNILRPVAYCCEIGEVLLDPFRTLDGKLIWNHINFILFVFRDIFLMVYLSLTLTRRKFFNLKPTSL